MQLHGLGRWTSLFIMSKWYTSLLSLLDIFCIYYSVSVIVFLNYSLNAFFINPFHLLSQDGRVNALYSTPSIYTDAKHAANEQWPLKTGDFFPWVLFLNIWLQKLTRIITSLWTSTTSSRYADHENAYWTGYFTSRPALKRYVREMSGYFLVSGPVYLNSRCARLHISCGEL